MDIPNLFKSFSPLEAALLVIFIFYIVLPIQTPSFFAGMVDSSLGMLTIFIVTVYLFFNVNPVLAVVYVFVAYELIRRSGNVTNTVTIMKHTPTQARKDAELKEMNPPRPETLEEEMVQNLAPIGYSDPSIFVGSTFKPLAEKINNASMYRN
jgi:hypothetical protein